MAGSVNIPGALTLGGLPSTASVSIGRGGALVVDNSGTGASGSVSFAPSVFTSALNLGTNPMTCGALSSGAIVAAGSVSCGANPLTCGALSSGAVVAAGTLSSGSNSVTCGALASGAIAAAGTLSCGTHPMTCGALSSGALVASGGVSCGANSMTCGAVSAATIASAGNVTYPRYALRVYKSADQSLSNATVTAITWDTVETTGGGATNWPFTPPASVITIPLSGRYQIDYKIGFANSAVGYRDTWAEVNVGSPGSSRRYGEDTRVPTGVQATSRSSFTYQFATGDTVLIGGFQSAGGSLDIPGLSGGQSSSLDITRLSE